MFRKLYNQALLTAELVPDGPVLIKEGGSSPDPAAPDLAFVRCWHNGHPTVYLPGSSLKGVLRAHAERLLATEVHPAAAEDPFDFSARRRVAAGEARGDGDTALTYRASCEADRLFGSVHVAGRLRIGDAFPSPDSSATANRTEIRWGVGIRRESGAGQNPFEQEAVTGGHFCFRLTLENYDLWMLALALQVVADLHAGFVQIGHSKSRGFGAVTVAKPALELRWPGGRPQLLEGAGAREPDAARRDRYGLDAEDAVAFPEGATERRVGLLGGARFAGWDSLDQLQAQLVPRWSAFVAVARKEADSAA